MGPFQQEASVPSLWHRFPRIPVDNDVQDMLPYEEDRSLRVFRFFPCPQIVAPPKISVPLLSDDPKASQNRFLLSQDCSRFIDQIQMIHEDLTAQHMEMNEKIIRLEHELNCQEQKKNQLEGEIKLLIDVVCQFL